jgi:hypothetical protein
MTELLPAADDNMGLTYIPNIVCVCDDNVHLNELNYSIMHKDVRIHTYTNIHTHTYT